MLYRRVISLIDSDAFYAGAQSSISAVMQPHGLTQLASKSASVWTRLNHLPSSSGRDW